MLISDKRLAISFLCICNKLSNRIVFNRISISSEDILDRKNIVTFILCNDRTGLSASEVYEVYKKKQEKLKLKLSQLKEPFQRKN